ncbi:Beta-lactamase-like protein 2 [Phytophthora pseudosyringae]|uniref:Beta-lactamase-like protein 2 n=1 Tax=Phytophthora pseudosyringae TaxID=221518 RepID=A0A8T1VKY5_9STRA|nr:Beta-lactamase-like protein 2 [Phytophthora pseudosyringae]
MWAPVLLGGVIAGAAWLLLRPLALYHGHKGLCDVPASTLVRFSLSVRVHSLILWISGVSRSLPTIPDVDRLPGHVLRVLGNNPSRMTLRGTNVYVVGCGSSRLLIDSSDGNGAFVERLLEACRRDGVDEISDLLVTHGHLDHVGGLLQLKHKFPAMKVWKYLPRAGREGDGDGDRRLRLSNQESRRLGIQALEDGQEFQVPGGKGVLKTVYTPGHCNDHVCFVLDGVGGLKTPVLFSGDCVLGVGSCMFDSLADLMASLAKLKECGAATIYPGHGPVVNDAPAKILEYITHRQQREDEILGVLKEQGGLVSSEIVDRIYEPLPYLLRLSARKAIDKHLQKLLVEQRVRQIRGAGWFQSAAYSLS